MEAEEEEVEGEERKVKMEQDFEKVYKYSLLVQKVSFKHSNG